MAKKEKTEFMVKIAEQINRNVTVSSSDELEEMPGKQPIDRHPAEELEEDGNGAKVVEEEGDHDVDQHRSKDQLAAPDDEVVDYIQSELKKQIQGDEEKKEMQRLDDDMDDIAGDIGGDLSGDQSGDGQGAGGDEDGKEMVPPRAHLDEEYKYDHLNGDDRSEDVAVRKRGKSSSSIGSSKSSKEGGNKQRDRVRRRRKERKKGKKTKVDWDQYPVFRPHDINGI